MCVCLHIYLVCVSLFVDLNLGSNDARRFAVLMRKVRLSIYVRLSVRPFMHHVSANKNRESVETQI